MKFLKKALCALLAVCMIFCGNTAVFAGEWGDNINAAEIIEQEEISRHLKIFGDVEYMYMPSSDPNSGNDEEIWYALTPCDQFKAGSIWYDRQIAAEAGFTVSFDYRMGGAGKFGFEEGELLGISFVEEIDFNDSNAVNYFAPYSYKVEIDPYRNTGDPLGGHIAIVQGMATRHLAYELRDDLVGNWHTVKVEYIPGNMKVYFDDDLLINENDIFLSDDIYMGINAYTTYPANEHLVKNVYVTGIISNGTEFTDDNDPIIIIPGIMGSRLFTSNTVFDNSTLVWDPPTETLGDAWDIHWLNERMDLNGNTQLYVRPCENQNDKNSGTVAEYGREYGSLDIYEELVDKLCANFPEREVYFFSYDWRLSNAVSANSLADFIDSLDAEKVDLVCHSMGGLVASQYFEDYGDEKTDTIITMGTPYEGAPKLINSVQNWDVLGTGAFGKNSIKDAFLAIFGGMTKEIKSSFSGVAELTPTENYIKRFPMWKDSAWPFGAGDYKLTYTEYANICKKIFDNFAQAQFVQNEILDESGFNLLLNYDKAYFVIGTGNKTITSVKFQYSNSDVDERLYESDLSYDNLGDGTVPYYSASVCDKIKYLDENRWFEINAEHNGMTSKNRVIRWVTEVLKYGVSAEKDDPLAKREYTTIRIACPVDVTVTNGEETLSSANGSLSTGASFGRLDIIGENDEIKMLCIDTSDEYDITINGTDSGTMDYAIRFFDEDGNQLDERIFEKVPVTENTVIKTNSAPEENTLLQVDTNGDGVSDEIWSAGKGDWVTADENARIPIESIGFEKNTVKINAGEQFDLAAKVYPENANDGVGFIYSSSDEAVAKVDENGTVSAIAAGTATIKATATNGMEAEIEVEVTEVTAKDFAGKKVSILSHSASTYAGVSNNTVANSTIGKNDVYYTEGKHGVYLKDTWWQQTIDALDMELLVNNSWNGSCVFQPRKGAASVTYGDRAINLHNDHTGEEPDIIFVYIGGNDFAYYKDTYGKAADIDYSALIKDNGDGTFTYAAPTTTCEAYAITLHKAQNRYPNAEIYCMTSTARRETDYTGDNYPDAGQPTEYSAELKKVARYFGFPVIDLENAIPKEVELFDKYMGDKRAHPNALGMDQITNEVLSVMLGKEAEIRHVTAEKGAVKEQAVLLGESYTAKAEVPESYTFSVFMDGKDVTEEVYSNGIISIEKITGDVEVKAVREATNFRWELNNDVFDSVSGNDFSENKLTLLEGNIKDGIFSGVKYSLADKINLYHNKPWVMEWACTGNWDATLFTESSTSGVKDSDFIFRSSTDHELLAIGAYDGKQYNNYGVSTKELDLDMTKRHVYRLENRVSENGNMVWLYIDGVEIGPMNNHYIGSKQNTGNTSDWVSGRDFTFGYMGTVVRAINYCSLEYVEVWENGKPEVKNPDWMIEDGEFNILLIGNSYTQDAANLGEGMKDSQLFNILSNMLGEDIKVTLGILSDGGRSVSWFATQAERDNKNIDFYVITPEKGIWTHAGKKSVEGALKYTDWDVVTLQPYSVDLTTGVETIRFPGETDKKFYPLESASEYMLDYIEKYAPQAEAYCYMHWAQTSAIKMNANLSKYNEMADFYLTNMEYFGPESGKQFKDIIPVGLSIQNARTTYLSLLSYNVEKWESNNINLKTDPQLGLQRDGGHLSLNVGRYIASLTFAETIIPEEIRAEGYVLPDIRVTESIGKLPKEYTEIAQKSVFAAVESWKNGSLEVTEIAGYKEDPTVAAAESLEEEIFTVGQHTNAEEIKKAVLAKLPEDFAVDKVVIPEDTSFESGSEFECTATIRFGYTSVDVAVKCKIPAYKVGDINRDGKVNTIDANYARRYAAGLLTLDEAQKLDGDVNLDGEVNVIDSAIIRRYVVKYITELPYKIS